MAASSPPTAPHSSSPPERSAHSSSASGHRSLFLALGVVLLLGFVWVAYMEVRVLSHRHANSAMKEAVADHRAPHKHHAKHNKGAPAHHHAAKQKKSSGGGGADSDAKDNDGDDGAQAAPPTAAAPKHHATKHGKAAEATPAPGGHGKPRHHHEKSNNADADDTDATSHAPVAGHAHHHAHREVHAKEAAADGDDATAKGPAATPAPAHHHHHHTRRHRHSGDGSAGAAVVEEMGEGSVAFAVVVSNEEFVDGALTLAWSFKNHSKLFASGHAKLAVVVPEGALCKESLERLRVVGWTDQRIVKDLTKEAPKSVWAGTFNKLYLFGLTEYKRVASFDVDMLMLRSPDDVFATKLPDARHIGALGNSNKLHPYFQTGMMLLWPTKDAFDSMMHDFRTKKDNKGVNGRDGVVVRRYYQDRYVNLDSALSAHLKPEEPLGSVIGFHFRGSWKPWFDRSLQPKKDPRKGVEVDREIGAAYHLWWATYEDLHQRVLAPLPLAAAERDPGHTTPPHFNPATHLWLMRHTPDSYVQALSGLEDSRHNKTIRGLVLEVSLKGESCDFVCGLRQAVCREDALSFAEVNSCDSLKAHFGCRQCEANGVPHPAQPALEVHTHKCAANPLVDPKKLPRCAEVSGRHRRLCPCLPLERAAGRVDAHPFAEAGGVASRLMQRKGAAASASSSKKGWAKSIDAIDDASDSSSSSSSSYAAAPKKSPCGARLDTSLFGRGTHDADCIAALRGVEKSAVSVGALPVSPYAGVTMKLLAELPSGARAVIKLPQPGFSHEPQSEVAAYHVDRLLGFNRVPPTAHVWLDEDWVAEALGNATAVTGNAAKTPAEIAAAVAAGSPRVQTKQTVTDFLSAAHEPLVKAKGAKGRLVSASVQLWVEDTHRLVDSTLAVSQDYEHWLAIGPTADRPAAEDDVAAATAVLPGLSDTVVFDFVIANPDRSLGKNLLVAGGCKTYCVNARRHAHVGSPALVWIDQGRSFYDADSGKSTADGLGNGNGDDADDKKVASLADSAAAGGGGEGGSANLLSIALDDERSAKTFCRTTKATRDALTRYTSGTAASAAAATDKEDKEEPPSFAAALTAALRDADAEVVVDVLGEQAFAKAQARVQRAARHLAKNCPLSDADAILAAAP